METQAPAPITRAELDWVCVAQRAADNDPHSQLLWVQATLAMSDVIMVCNVLARDEAHAAHAQALVNQLAALACENGTEDVAVMAEALKDAIVHISAGGRNALAMLL